MKREYVVIDAAALLDLMVSTDVGVAVQIRLEGCLLNAPCTIDAEVVAALEHLERTGVIGRYRALDLLDTLAAAPIERHPLPDLLEGAWRLRHDLPLSKALYVELAYLDGMILVTTDPGLAELPRSIVEVVGRRPLADAADAVAQAR